MTSPTIAEIVVEYMGGSTVRNSDGITVDEVISLLGESVTGNASGAMTVYPDGSMTLSNLSRVEVFNPPKDSHSIHTCKQDHNYYCLVVGEGGVVEYVGRPQWDSPNDAWYDGYNWLQKKLGSKDEPHPYNVERETYDLPDLYDYIYSLPEEEQESLLDWLDSIVES